MEVDDILKALDERDGRKDDEYNWFLKECDLYPRLLAFDLRTTKAVDVSNAENLAAANKKKGRDMILIIRTEAPN